MKKIACFLLLSVLFTSCARSRNEMWEDTKTAGRHVSRGFRYAAGMQNDSRQIRNRNEFICHDDGEYIPLQDHPHNSSSYHTFEEKSIQETRNLPGEEGSSIPGIEGFYSPSSKRDTAGIFHNIEFPYNSSLVKGRENLVSVRGISEYLVQHPKVYIFIEGHCDERGPQAYNLALGARRANAVRNLLIKEGVSPNQIFTISYGKEKPTDLAHNEDAWQKNRRGEFKIYHNQGK